MPTFLSQFFGYDNNYNVHTAAPSVGHLCSLSDDTTFELKLIIMMNIKNHLATVADIAITSGTLAGSNCVLILIHITPTIPGWTFLGLAFASSLDCLPTDGAALYIVSTVSCE